MKNLTRDILQIVKQEVNQQLKFAKQDAVQEVLLETKQIIID